MTAMTSLGSLWNSIQTWLFPMLEDELGELDDKHREFVAVWDFPTIRDLIDAVRHRPTLRRLCGWETFKEVPSESTFSRTFAAFAEDHPPQHCFLRFCKRIEKSFV